MNKQPYDSPTHDDPTSLLRGVLPILHTPFSPEDEIDREALNREIDWVFEAGADGCCSAMVSEILQLTEQERFQLTEWMVEAVADRGAVIASVGAESTRLALRYARQAEAAGCTAVMAVPPIHKPLPEPALWRYFNTLADGTELPLIVQDASSYVGQAMSTPFLARLLEHYGPDKILFKPEAAPLGPNLSALRDATSGRARCFDGSGGLLLVDTYRRGIAGTMPGCDLLDAIVMLWHALVNGDEVIVDRLAPQVAAIVALQMQAGLDGFVAIEKAIMVRRGLFPYAHRREPVAWELDEETSAEVDRLISGLATLVTTLAADRR